jgi:thiol:disulfide interchange protein DsbD
MKVKLFFALAIVLLLLAVAPLFRAPEQPIAWRSSPERAFDEAARGNLPVLVFLYTDWCTYCRQMDQTTFSDPDVVRQMSSDYVWLRLNAETDPFGIRMQRRFSVSGFPTLLILDSKGNEIDRLQGYVPPHYFADAVRTLTTS